jgi:hypothetical protein
MPLEDPSSPPAALNDWNRADRRSRSVHRLAVTTFDIEPLVIAVQAARPDKSVGQGHDLPCVDAGANIVRRWLNRHSES